jgi:hypothetical protein
VLPGHDTSELCRFRLSLQRGGEGGVRGERSVREREERDLELFVVLCEDGVNLWLVDVAHILPALNPIEPHELVAPTAAIDDNRESASADRHHTPQHLDHLRAEGPPQSLSMDPQSRLSTPREALDSQRR